MSCTRVGQKSSLGLGSYWALTALHRPSLPLGVERDEDGAVHIAGTAGGRGCTCDPRSRPAGLEPDDGSSASPDPDHAGCRNDRGTAGPAPASSSRVGERCSREGSEAGINGHRIIMPTRRERSLCNHRHHQLRVLLARADTDGEPAPARPSDAWPDDRPASVLYRLRSSGRHESDAITNAADASADAEVRASLAQRQRPSKGNARLRCTTVEQPT